MKLYSIALFLLINFLALPTVLATSVIPIDLEQLSTRAALIFYGKVISNVTRKDEKSGFIATFTEFQIIEPIKGETGNTLTIKQLGGESKDDNIVMRIPGVPRFITGKDYVVFLPKKSNLGFSSPLGLHQGSFEIKTINGEQTVRNALRVTSTAQHNNNNLQIPLAVSNENPSTSRLEDFINTVRAYNTH